jgi:PAS domain S-box-containing protein
MKNENINPIKNLSLSYDIALAIGSSPDLKEMLDHFLKTVIRKGNAFQGIIWLRNGKELEIASVAGFNTNTIDGTAAGFPGQGLKTVLESGRPLIKTDQDDDFQEFCIPSASYEKLVLLQPVGKLALIQISFPRANAQSKRLTGTLAGISPILENAIQTCLNHHKLLTIERNQRRLSEIRFYDLVSKLKYGIFFGNMEGHYFYVNDAFLKLFGFNNMQELGFSWESLFKDQVQKEYFIQELNDKAYVQGLEILAKSGNGEASWVQVTASLGHFMDYQTLSIMGIVEDITGRKQLEETLRKPDGTGASSIVHLPLQGEPAVLF